MLRWLRQRVRSLSSRRKKKSPRRTKSPSRRNSTPAYFSNRLAAEQWSAGRDHFNKVHKGRFASHFGVPTGQTSFAARNNNNTRSRNQYVSYDVEPTSFNHTTLAMRRHLRR